tara:strand:+ start:7674 stop:8036 length:363 start_codon:yes stop_codon:yes gene_type:complete
MKKRFHYQEGFLSTLLTAILFFLIATATEYFKHFFVHDTGNIKIFGGIGILLAIGLLFKVKFTRYILSVITLLAIAMTLFMIFWSGKEFVYAHSTLLVALGLVAYFLVFSDSVKKYGEKK